MLDQRIGNGKPHAVHAGKCGQHFRQGHSEDHVANSTWCARKAAPVVANTQYIVGVELLLAAQALTMTEGMLPGFVLG